MHSNSIPEASALFIPRRFEIFHWRKSELHLLMGTRWPVLGLRAFSLELTVYFLCVWLGHICPVAANSHLTPVSYSLP